MNVQFLQDCILAGSGPVLAAVYLLIVLLLVIVLPSFRVIGADTGRACDEALLVQKARRRITRLPSTAKPGIRRICSSGLALEIMDSVQRAEIPVACRFPLAKSAVLAQLESHYLSVQNRLSLKKNSLISVTFARS